ncbi:MAG: ATP-binding cassette domain-containing protein, partial [Actinobacteria bacterium]|nr:ATP-binding cassette domain-containing protein [Actinomycetota bacterium]
MTAIESTAEALRCEQLRVTFWIRRAGSTHEVHAVDGVDVRVERGRILGVVGESGSGKSTLARALVGIQPATSGTVTCGDLVIDARRRAQRRVIGRRVAMIFQDPRSSLNPRISVAAAVADPLV